MGAPAWLVALAPKAIAALGNSRPILRVILHIAFSIRKRAASSEPRTPTSPTTDLLSTTKPSGLYAMNSSDVEVTAGFSLKRTLWKRNVTFWTRTPTSPSKIQRLTSWPLGHGQLFVLSFRLSFWTLKIRPVVLTKHPNHLHNAVCNILLCSSPITSILLS